MMGVYEKFKNNRYLKTLGPIGILLFIFIFMFISTPTFRSPMNILQILLSSSIYILLAMGMSFVIITGGIDLSLGAIIGLVGGLFSFAMMTMPLWMAMIVGVLVGVACGILNGFMVTVMGLAPFIATLGSSWIFRGILLLLNNGAIITVRGVIDRETLQTLNFIGNGRTFGIPNPIYVVVVLAIALAFLLSKTVYGRSVYATGSNPEAARMSGINIRSVKWKTYILAGTLAGIAGVILMARMQVTQPNTGQGYEFEGIFSAIIGGISFAGGEGNVLGAVVGAVIVAILRNGLNLNGINSFWQQVILGVLVIVIVYVDTLKTKKARNP